MLDTAKNLSLSAKGWIIVAITAVSLLTISWIAGGALFRSSDQMHRVSESVIPSFLELKASTSTLQSMHLETLRLITWANMGIDGETMERQTALINEIQEQVLGELSTTDDGATSLYLAFKDDISSYIDAADQAIDMTLMDPTMGSMIANDADQRFSALMEKVSALAAEKSDQHAEVTQAYAQDADRALLSVMAGILIALSLSSVLVAWAVRSVNRPLVEMIGSMKHLAENRLDAPIPGIDLTNEVGQMAAALSVFRDNAKERARLEASSEEQRRTAAMRSARAQDLQTELADILGRARHGIFSERMTGQYEYPEMASIADSINALLGTVDDGLDTTKRSLKFLAEGNLARRMDGRFEGAFAELQADMNATFDRLSSVVAQIQTAADGITGSTTTIASDAADLASRTESQAASLEETSAAMNSMTKTTRENAASARDAQKLSLAAAERATDGANVVKETVAAIGRIEASSERIKEIVSVIDSIAFQTNLLALNASVEAARAGAAGQGFSVVASEVRQLAQRSADAAQDISKVIGESGSQVSDGVKLVHRTGASLDEIVKSIDQVTSKMDDISASSSDQDSDIAAISIAVSQVDEATQNNTAIAARSAASAQEVSSACNRLVDLVGIFTLADQDTNAPDIMSMRAQRDAFSDSHQVA